MKQGIMTDSHRIRLANGAAPLEALPDAGMELLRRIEAGSAVVGIVGLGYVGLPLAVAFARRGLRVTGYDVSADVVAGINRGHSHVKDVASQELGPLVEQDMLRATADAGELAEADAVCVCVPTPLGKTRDPDMSYVVAATDALADILRPGQLLVLKSTTYPGTTRELVLPRLERDGFRVGEEFFLCFSPERVDPGNAVWRTDNTPKVVGGITPACITLGTALFSQAVDSVVPVSSPEAAELTKLLENTFRAVNIALVNEMAQVADRLGVDIWEVIDAADTKPFGFMKFTPGPGIGGHCIPLDPHYLAWKMKTLSYRTRMIELASEINAEMPRYVAGKVQDALNQAGKAVKSSRVLVLGVAYKKDIDDVRESPALDIIRLLDSLGADVVFHDPYVKEIRVNGGMASGVEFSDTELEAADCVVVVTDHSEVDYDAVVRQAALVVDTRNVTPGAVPVNVVGLSGSRPAEAVPEAGGVAVYHNASGRVRDKD